MTAEGGANRRNERGDQMELDPSAVRILLAEDDPTNQYVFTAILHTAGFEPILAENGLQALERARAQRPHLFLLDMMMPVMDGYETAWRIVQDPEFDGVPILALTARAMQGDEERTLQAGCDDYLSKPVRRQEFLAKVHAWLRRDPSEWMPRRLAMRVPQRDSA
ncbi:MAG: response regulator [Candidatus Eisenbacteria bacterium]|nr:response regulator [Candidatus Eisenbacteria bacterium]